MARLGSTLIFLGILVSTFRANAGESPTIVILSLHDDAAIAGALQQSLEASVAVASGVSLRSSAVVAAKYSPATEQNADGTIAKKLEASLASAREAYWDDDLVSVDARLAEAKVLLERMGPYPSIDPARLAIWRVAVLLAKQDEVGAEGEARRVLNAAPDIQVDLDLFRPSVGKLVERVRASQPRPSTVVLSGSPRGARSWVDSRLVLERCVVAPGRHRLHVEGPGFRSVDRSFEAMGDITLSAALAPELPKELSSLLVAFARGKELDDKERTSVWEILFRVNADAVAVVAREENGIRARTFRGKSSSAPSGIVPLSSDGEKSLAEWIVASRVATAASPVTSVASAEAVEWDVRGGVTAATREWNLKSNDGGRFTTAHSGGGPALRAQVGSGSIVAELTADFVDFGSRAERVDLGGGTQAKASGGSISSVGLGAGYRFMLGDARGWPSVTALAGGTFDHYRSRGLRDASGDLGLLPSTQRIGAELGARAKLPLRLLPRARATVFSIEGAISPWSDWQTTPSDALGNSPRGNPSWSWGAAVDAGLSRRCTARIQYAGRLRSVSFTGTGNAPVDPSLRGAEASEASHAVSVTVGRDF